MTATGGNRPSRLRAAALLLLSVATVARASQAAEVAIEVPGAGRVAVYRDYWGVPHVFAANEPDGYFGMGYAQAEDQLTLLIEMFNAQGRRYVNAGSRALRLVAFTDPIKSYSLHLYGQSDDPASAHYDDQVALASERRLKPVYFTPAELAGHVESVRVLEVRKAGD
jgi:acyl-homoserine lactone acylase PvdQ